MRSAHTLMCVACGLRLCCRQLRHVSYVLVLVKSALELAGIQLGLIVSLDCRCGDVEQLVGRNSDRDVSIRQAWT